MGLGAEGVGTGAREIDRLIKDAQSWLHRDGSRCLRLLERAESAMEGRRDLPQLARIHEMRGDVGMAVGELGAAATAYRQARWNWLTLGRRWEALRSKLGGAAVQISLGEFAEAEAVALQVQARLNHESSQEDGRVSVLDATVHRLLADARAGLGDLATAARHYDTAENLYAALGDDDGMATVDLRRALADLDAGLAHNAMIELNRARVAYLRSGRERAAALVAVLIAEALSATGQGARSLELLDCLGPEGSGGAWHVGAYRLVRSGALLRAGLPAEAHAEARAAEEVFTRIGAVEHAARAALACGRASLRWGRASVAAGEIAAAERVFAECGSHLMRVRAWLAQAELALAVGDHGTARATCRRVLAAEIDGTAPYLGVQTRLMLARVEEPSAASALLDAATALAARTGMPALRVDVLVARARHLRRTGRRDEATESLRSALGVGRAWQHHLGQHGTGTVCPSLAEATDELIVQLLARDDHAGRVEAWRRARAAKGESLVPWAEWTHRSASLVSDGARRQRVEELLSEVRTPAGAGSGGVEEALPPVPNGSFVEYYVTGEHVIAFVVRDGQVDARSLGEIATETRRMLSAWQHECRLMAPGSAVVDGPMSSPSLDALFELLLAPIADLLADLDDELHVNAHRHLHAVPFDALLDEIGPWYARLHLAVSPSLELPRTESDQVPGVAALVIAVPDENAPLIRAEAEMIFRTLPSAEIVLGDDATRDALVGHARAADLVHFACHGVFRQENPLSSALRLGDGWLLARDISSGSLGIEGSVVVLSACGSGLSPDYVSEPIGLASACLAAGASGVVAALWTVDDAVTLELMTFLYRGIAEGLGPASALRHARRQVARAHPHAYFWAAFQYFPGGVSTPGHRQETARNLAAPVDQRPGALHQ